VLFASVAVAARPVPGQPVRRSHVRADLEHRWTPAGVNWFVPIGSST
jgi:hypothetical protein